MKAESLALFRTMQLAIQGASKHQVVEKLILDGIDKIVLGEELYITEISLNMDLVVVSLYDNECYVPLTNLSERIIKSIISTMRDKALEIADKVVYVNNGEAIE